MTIWRPDRGKPGVPLYQSLADSIARGIERGELSPGDRLPAQRELAEQMGIALTTVGRGYAEAERRGLVRGEVGRGTFVRGRQRPDPVEAGPSRVDLRPNWVLPYPMLPELSFAMARVAAEVGERHQIGPAPPGGLDRHREGAAAWLTRTELATAPGDLLLTAGAQHGLAVVLGTILDPGNTLLVGSLTYAGIKALAGFLGLRLEALPMDGEGILPDALRAACTRRNPPHALYCMSTLQTPTSAVLSDGRRREIAEIADVFRLPVIEDDTLGFLLPGHAPIAASCRYAYYVTGLSKSLLPTLRIGLLRGPRGMTHRLEAAISSTASFASPLAAEIVTGWLEDGTAARIIAWKRAETRDRQQMMVHALSPFDYRTHPFSPQGWLTLPEPWTARDFVAQAVVHGVDVMPGEEFAVGRSALHAVRLCVGAAADRNQLAWAASHLVAILNDQPAPRRFEV